MDWIAHFGQPSAAYLRESVGEQEEYGAFGGPRWEALKSRADEMLLQVTMSTSDDVCDAPESATGFAWALKALMAGRVEVLLIHRLADLGRSVEEIRRVWASTFATGDRWLVTVSEGFDTRDDQTRLLISSLLWSLERCQELTSSDLAQRELTRRRQAGLKLGGAVPYGYRVGEDEQTLEKNPEEQRFLRRIQKLRKDGVSIRGIADQLNGDSVPARGQRWHPTTVARLLERSTR